MRLLKIDGPVERLDSHRPSLKTEIQSLKSLLSPLIEGCCLPDWKLKLEILSESQITSGENETRSLRELFEFTDDCLSFLTEEALSDRSPLDTEASPDRLVSL